MTQSSAAHTRRWHTELGDDAQRAGWDAMTAQRMGGKGGTGTQRARWARDDGAKDGWGGGCTHRMLAFARMPLRPTAATSVMY